MTYAPDMYAVVFVGLGSLATRNNVDVVASALKGASERGGIHAYPAHEGSRRIFG
jgi:hypothetical protein